MRKALWLIPLALAAGCGDDDTSDGSVLPDASVPPDLQPYGPRKLVILHTNDEHSHLFAFAPELDDYPEATTAGSGPLKGGVTRRMTVLKQERAAAAANGADTLTLSAGDNVMGSLTQVGFAASGPDFTLMKEMGYDATCLGNHEFDYGPKNLAAALTAAKSGGGLIPTVSTNIHFSSTDPGDDDLAAGYSLTPDPSKLVEKYHVITTAQGIKVGLIGILGQDGASVEHTKAPVTFSQGASMDETNIPEVMAAIYTDVQSTVDLLRNTEKVDLVIALDHAGQRLDDPTMGEDYQIAQNVSGIDLIISGHTHTVVPTPQLPMNMTTQKVVPVVQSGSFGVYVGELALTVESDGSITFDLPNYKLVPVDETVVPDPGMIGMAQAQAVHDLESKPWGTSSQSFLEGTLSRVTGTTVMDDPNTDGDLYFYALGHAPFDIEQVSFHETSMLDLVTDAELAAGDEYLPTGSQVDLSVSAAGVIRGSLPQGKTGTLDIADLFRVLALGSSPVDGSIGYPLVNVYMRMVYIKAAFELLAAKGLTNDDDFLVTSGMKVEFDTDRPYFDTTKSPTDPANGRVTKITWNSNHAKNGFEAYDTVLFDASLDKAHAWLLPDGTDGSLNLYSIITSYYIASFAKAVGVALNTFDPNWPQDNKPVQYPALTDLTTVIIHRTDGSEVKDFESLAEFVRTASTANGGTLPDAYDATSVNGGLPHRVFCSGSLCPQGM